MTGLTGVASFRLQDLGQSSPEETDSEASFHDARSAGFPRSASTQSLSSCMSFPLRLLKQDVSTGSETEDPDKLVQHYVDDSYAHHAPRHEPPNSPPCSKRTKSSHPSLPARAFTAPKPAVSKDLARSAATQTEHAAASLNNNAAACVIPQRAHAQISVIHEGVVEFRLRLSPPFLFGANQQGKPASQVQQQRQNSPAPPSPLTTHISSTPPSHVGQSTGLWTQASPQVPVPDLSVPAMAEDEATPDIQGPTLSGSPLQRQRDQTHKLKWSNPLTKSFKELLNGSLFSFSSKFNVVPPTNTYIPAGSAGIGAPPATTIAEIAAANAPRQIHVNVAMMAPGATEGTTAPLTSRATKPAVKLGSAGPSVPQPELDGLSAAADTVATTKQSLEGISLASNLDSSVLIKQPSDLTAALGMVTGRSTHSAAGEHGSTDGGAGMPELHPCASPDRPHTSGGGTTEEPARCSTPERLPGSNGGSKVADSHLQLQSTDSQQGCADGDIAEEEAQEAQAEASMAAGTSRVETAACTPEPVLASKEAAAPKAALAPLSFGVRNDTAAAAVTAARRAAATKKAYKVMTRVVRKMLPNFKGMYSSTSSMGGSNAASTEGPSALKLMGLARQTAQPDTIAQGADEQAVLLGRKRKAEEERYPEDEGRWAPDAPATRVSQALSPDAPVATEDGMEAKQAPAPVPAPIVPGSLTTATEGVHLDMDPDAVINNSSPTMVLPAAPSEPSACAAENTPEGTRVGFIEPIYGSAATEVMHTGGAVAASSTAQSSAAAPNGVSSSTGVVHVQVVNSSALEAYTINSPGFEHGAPKPVAAAPATSVLAPAPGSAAAAALVANPEIVPCPAPTQQSNTAAGANKLAFLSRFLCACFAPSA